ncbi:MAG TPA: ROK family transcriptional regulator [Actinomycetota bacterium]|nr:ROK family transcriptional regulator [Actinomycetota bacterium]
MRTGQSPARQDALRQHNLALVLQHIAAGEPVSRARIAAVTSLTKTTVSSLVDDLVSARLVVELGPEARGEIGRPASALTLDRTGYAGIGLEINVDYIAVCVTNLVGEVRYLRTRPRDNRGQSPARVLGRALRMTRTAVARAEASRLTVAGLGVAVPGPVETDSGLLRLAPNLGWVDVPVAEILADRLAGLAVVVDNEANLAALGELWFGGHDGLVDFVHVSGEIGVGGGVIVGEELFRGARGFAGEIGHVVVQPDGPRCRCGARGCLEQVAGQEAILRSAGLTGAVGTSIGQPRGSVAELLAGARAGDPGTLRAVSEAGRALGIGLSATVNIVDPSTVVLGGLYAALEPWLSKPLLEELSERAITHRWSPVQVLASRLGPDAAVRGAAGTVVKRVLSEPAAVFRATGRHVAPTPPRPD